MALSVTVVSEDTIRCAVSINWVQAITSGIALLDFSDVPETAGDWTRVDAVFLVGPTMANCSIKQYIKSLPLVTPATIDIADNMDTSKSIGWGIDLFSSIYDPTSDRVQVTARVVVKSKYSEMLRISYQVVTLGLWDQDTPIDP